MTNTYNANLPERTAIVAIVLISFVAMIYACVAAENPSPLHPILLALAYTCMRIGCSFMYAIETGMLANSQQKPLSMWPKIIILGLVTATMGMAIPEKELLLFCLAPMWAAMAIHLKQDYFQD